MTTNILKRKSPDPWPIFLRYKSPNANRSPLPTVSAVKVTGSGRTPFFYFVFGVFIGLFSISFVPARAAVSDDSIRSYIHNGGYALQTANGAVVGFNADTPFIPASTIKLITCLAALDLLGPDYRFETRFYTDSRGNLIIQGDGDPMLTSEEVSAIARELATKGLKQITGLILDDSTFALEGDVDGSEHSDRPYDATIGPLAVNFNALPIRVHPDGRIDSGEEQTPILPMMTAIGKAFPPGLYRVNIGAFAPVGSLANELQYTDELFKTLLRQRGIEVKEATRLGKVPDNASLLLVHKSDTLKLIVKECLKFSNNFIANELFLACGRQQYGFPLTWAKAQDVLKNFIEKTFHPAPGKITMVEGSGLSRKNRITPRMMLKVLERFFPYADLLPIKHDLLIKSGTLKGVYCYAGYLEDHGHTTPFVIMLNQETNNRDRILRTLDGQLNKVPVRKIITR